LALACLYLGLASRAYAGGSGLNTIVIVNQLSSNSCEVANYFCERRQVPPENVLRINWPGGNTTWTSNDFQITLLNPLFAMLAARQLTNQADYVVLSMDLPFQTLNGTLPNGTTSVLFYGLKLDSGPGWQGITNSYSGSEQIFARAKPASASGYSFLSTMLTANTVAQAKALIDQGVASDGTFPAQTVMLAKSSDSTRNIRYKAFDNAVFNTRFGRNYSVQRTNSDSIWGQTNLLGFETGLANLSLSPKTFIPGAMADSLTSYGGLIFGPNGQVTALDFVGAGAAGSYGTVTEPSAVAAKFPDPQNYFYQSRGFSLAECYYQSIFQPYEGLIVGEPLAAPCQRPGSGQWLGVSSNALLSGTAQPSLQFTSPDGQHSLQQVDLFTDGKYWRTLTNLAPQAGNVLTVTLNGYPLNYTVPTNSTLATLATNLAAALNAPAYTNITKTAAFVHGDRIELHAASTNSAADPFFFTDTTAGGSPRFYRAVYLSPPTVPVLSALGRDSSGAFRLHVEARAAMPCVLQASTDLRNWQPLLTNLLGGPMDFVDPAAAGYPKRFYRVAASVPDNRPRLSALGRTQTGGFKVRVQSPAAPFSLDASSDLVHWTSLVTNQTAGTLDLEDTAFANFARRFYRATARPQPAPTSTPTVSEVRSLANGLLLRVDGATNAYIIQVSTDLIHWSPLSTNLSLGKAQLAASAAKGAAQALSTSVTASRGVFLDSVANGTRSVSVNGIMSVGTWLQLTVTKTNGARVNVGVTNQIVTATILDLLNQFTNAINSSLALQGTDGLVAEDLAPGWFGASGFNLRVRGTGQDAAGIKVLLSAPASSLVLNLTGEVALNQNFSDLQPRNQLYLTAGATNLALSFPLDTTALPDGYHQLTAVAYEGSHVRTQTRTTLPIRVQNSSLTATLTPLDVSGTASVQGTYHFQVAANTNNVTAIRLFSTGGQLDVVTSQPSATFTVNGTSLGVGLHPFYAVVETAAGLSYRTDTRFVRLTAGP